MVAKAVPAMRIRFSTSNPHEMTEEVFRVIAKYDNVCKYIHLPVQSGSDRILQKMNRQHTRQEYLDLIKKAKEISSRNCFFSRYDCWFLWRNRRRSSINS